MAAGSRGFRPWGPVRGRRGPFMEPGDAWQGPVMDEGGPWFKHDFRMMLPPLPDRPPFRPDLEYPSDRTPRFDEYKEWPYEMETPHWELPAPQPTGFQRPFDHSRVHIDHNFYKGQNKKRVFSSAHSTRGKESAKKFGSKTTPSPQTRKTAAENGNAKKVEGNKDSQIKQPNKKPKMEEGNHSAKTPQAKKDSKLEPSVYVAPRSVYSCKLCRFETPDGGEFQKHLSSSQHLDVMKHLYIFLPKQRVNFLKEYILYEKRRVSQEQMRLKLQPRKDSFKGIGQEHFFHRVEVARCSACDSIIPDDPELLTEHIKSETHVQKCKATAKEIKSNCLAAAKALLQDEYILHLLNLYSKGRNLSTYIEKPTAHVVGNHEVLVAEEDDVVVVDDDDSMSEDEAEYGSSEIADCTEDPVSQSSPQNLVHPASPEVQKSDDSDSSTSSTIPDDEIVNDEEAAEAQ